MKKLLFVLVAAGQLAAQNYAVNTFWGNTAVVGQRADRQHVSGDLHKVAFDAAGNFWVNDCGLRQVYHVNRATNKIDRVMGDGLQGAPTEGGSASGQRFLCPIAVAVSPVTDDIYVVDNQLHKVFKIGAVSDVITTVAGTGVAGDTGDGGPATSAQLSSPRGLTVHPNGNVCFVNLVGFNSRIRCVAPGGTISAFGTNIPGGITGGIASSGAGILQGSQCAIYFTPFATGVTTLAAGSTNSCGSTETPDGGSAFSGSLRPITSLGVDSSGHVYFGSSFFPSGQHSLRRYDQNSGILSTVAALSTPVGGIGIHGSGAIATAQAGVVLLGSTTLGSLSPFVFGSSNISQLRAPIGVAYSATQGVLVTDSYENTVWSSTFGRIAGNGTPGYSGDGGNALSAQLSLPLSVAEFNNKVYITDLSNTIRVVDRNNGNVITTFAGTGVQGYNGDGIPATSAQLNLALGVTVDSAGNVYFADVRNHRIRRIANGIITTVAGNGTQGYGGDGGPATSASLNEPHGVVVAPNGDMYISDRNNHCVRKVTAATGIITTVAGTGVPGLSGDGGLGTNAQFNNTFGLALAPGNQLLIVDHGNDRLRRLDLNTGILTNVAGTSYGFDGDGFPVGPNTQFRGLIGVAVDNVGSIYALEQGNHRVRKLNNNSINATFATNPGGLAVTVNGTTAANQVRQLSPLGFFNLNAPSPQSGAPGTRYIFANWAHGGAQSQVAQAPAFDTTYTANFATEHQLTVNVAGGGTGTVSPASGTFHAAGGSVTLTPTAGACSVFQSFSPAATVVMNAPTTVTANFASTAATVAAVNIVRGTPRFNRLTNRYQQVLTITNPGAAVSGALSFDGLPAGVALVSPNAGTTTCTVPAGQPLRTLSVGTGATVSLTVEFTAPNATTAITYTNRMLTGGTF